MKLVNPTDDQLNAAFAERVAGWMKCERLGKVVFYDPEGGHVLEHELSRFAPRFTESADAVLPWLQKWDNCTIRFGVNHDGSKTPWRCFLCKEDDVFPEWEGVAGLEGESDSFPRACVIALLRAHGVEITLTE